MWCILGNRFRLFYKSLIFLQNFELKNREKETLKFDIADYLDSNEMIAEYLNAVLAEGNDSDVITAIGHIAKSIRMAKIAQEARLSRPSL